MSCEYIERVLRVRVLACKPCITGAGWPHVAAPAVDRQRAEAGDVHVQHPHEMAMTSDGGRHAPAVCTGRRQQQQKRWHAAACSSSDGRTLTLTLDCARLSFLGRLKASTRRKTCNVSSSAR